MELVDGVVAAGPDVVGQLAGEGRVAGHIALRGHGHARANLSDIRMRESAVDADSKNVGLLLVGPRPRQAVEHGPDVGAPAVGLFQHGAGHAQGDRVDLALHRALQDVGGMPCCDAHVGVRVGLE